ncbi:MAG TPA: response regulator [bacterium]|nr:response regulator [bacterium]
MKRILLVDDSPTLVQAAYDELDEKGYLVEVAYHGKAAVKYLEENPDAPPGLIIMDIEMPKMKGDEAARVIRQNPAWKDIPIIALTAVAPDSLGRNLAYFDNYLVKPFGFNEMLELVERTIGPAD